MIDYAVGDLIDGRYRVEREIGSGGMATSYQAVDEVTGSEVVVKIPSLQLIGDPAAFSRFKREREIGQRLDHPRIQKVVRAGQFAGGAPYLVLSYAPGIVMRRYLSERAPLSVSESVRLGAQLADALTYCHEHGVIHEDVKPENLIRTPSGDLVLLDFGIARATSRGRINLDRFAREVGTPDYMAPEQLRGDVGDERADVYALGVILHEMLTGMVPFGEGANALAPAGERLAQEAPPVRLRRSAIPWQLDAVVGRALRRDRRERYQTMAELREDLMHLTRVDLSATGASERGWSVGAMPSLGRSALVIGLSLAALVLIGVIAQVVHQNQLR
ncbi:MAG TPA: serine/threonine-protein kinase [Candidatus Acidoferrales bacterium]|nr:serine/threonine-protein kinase [Candidatus Acidoferrales bacterium]